MTTQVSGIGAFVPHPPHPPRVIPFGNTDLHGPGTRTWESRPPPSDWATREVSTLRSCCPVRSCYSGWARLKNLSRVSVYGNMKGIMFSYTDGTRDSFFGCIDGHEPVSIQEFAAGERVIGYATLPSELDAPSEMEKLSIVFSSTPNQCGICANVERIFVSHTTHPLGGFNSDINIQFMTTKNDSERPAHSKCFVQDADFVGLRFDFTAAGLISWAPLFEKPEPCKITFMRSRKSWPFHTRALEREIYSGDRQSMGFPLDNMARIG